MHSNLTEWNNIDLGTGRIGVVMVSVARDFVAHFGLKKFGAQAGFGLKNRPTIRLKTACYWLAKILDTPKFLTKKIHKTQLKPPP